MNVKLKIVELRDRIARLEEAVKLIQFDNDIEPEPSLCDKCTEPCKATHGRKECSLFKERPEQICPSVGQWSGEVICEKCGIRYEMDKWHKCVEPNPTPSLSKNWGKIKMPDGSLADFETGKTIPTPDQFRDTKEMVAPKPSVEKCDTITIPRSVVEEVLRCRYSLPNELYDALKVALSKNVNGKGEGNVKPC